MNGILLTPDKTTLDDPLVMRGFAAPKRRKSLLTSGNADQIPSAPAPVPDKLGEEGDEATDTAPKVEPDSSPAQSWLDRRVDPVESPVPDKLDEPQPPAPAPRPAKVPSLLHAGESVTQLPELTPEQKMEREVKAHAPGQGFAQGPSTPPQHKFGLKDALITGLAGFFAGAGQPNVAHGGGTDLMRAGEAGLQTGAGIWQNAQQHALDQRLKQAEIRQKDAQAYWEQSRPENEYYRLLAAQKRAEMQDAEARRNHDFQHEDRQGGIDQRREGTDVRRELGLAGIAQRGNYQSIMGNMRAYGQQVSAANKGFQAPTVQAIQNGTAGAPQIETDESKLPLAQQAALAYKRGQSLYMDKKTGEVMQRMAFAPTILELKKQQAAAATMNALAHQQDAGLAAKKYDFEYKGLDENKQPILIDPESGERVIPKVQAMDRLPAAMQSLVGQSKTIQSSAAELKQMVQQLTDEGKIGPGMGRWQQLKGAVGMSDPDVKKVMSALHYLASFQPKVHSLRTQRAFDGFQATIGGLEQRPETVQAALDELIHAAGQIEKDQGQVYRPKHPSVTPPTNAPTTAPPNAAGGGQVPPGHTVMIKPDGSRVAVPTEKVQLKSKPPYNYTLVK